MEVCRGFFGRTQSDLIGHLFYPIHMIQNDGFSIQSMEYRAPSSFIFSALNYLSLVTSLLWSGTQRIWNLSQKARDGTQIHHREALEHIHTIIQT